jgi:hypothetical protein
MSEYIVRIDDDYDGPALRQELARAVELVLQAAREKFYRRNQVIRRGVSGYDGNAVTRTADLKQRQDDKFQKDFGRPQS